MPDIEEAIGRLEAAGFRFNPPAPPEEIEALEEALGCPLPPEMAALYRHGNGTLPFDDDWDEGQDLGSVFHLMPAEEAGDGYGPGDACRFFWTDEQSNYAALYVEGPLAGRVCLISHDGPDVSPVYRSVPSLLTAVAGAGKGGFFLDEIPSPDYPAPGPVDPASDREDWEAAQALMPAFEAAESDDRVDYASQVMTVTPYEHTGTLLPFTEEADFYIVEKACDILGLRRWEPAIPRLAEVALHGVSNGKSAAIRALGRIATPEALRELVRVHEVLPAREADGYWYLFADAFAACGCEVDRSDADSPRYREPGASEGKPLRKG